MATKTIYVNPGDTVEIRIINDPDLPKNAAEWRWSRGQQMLLRVADGHRLQYADPSLRVEQWRIEG